MCGTYTKALVFIYFNLIEQWWILTSTSANSNNNINNNNNNNNNNHNHNHNNIHGGAKPPPNGS